MPPNITNSENLISELKKHNINLFGDVDKFLQKYSKKDEKKKTAENVEDVEEVIGVSYYANEKCKDRSDMESVREELRDAISREITTLLREKAEEEGEGEDHSDDVFLEDLKKYNFKVYEDVERFLQSYSKNLVPTRSVNDEILEIVQLCNLDDRYRTTSEESEEDRRESQKIEEDASYEFLVSRLKNYSRKIFYDVEQCLRRCAGQLKEIEEPEDLAAPQEGSMEHRKILNEIIDNSIDMQSEEIPIENLKETDITEEEKSVIDEDSEIELVGTSVIETEECKEEVISPEISNDTNPNHRFQGMMSYLPSLSFLGRFLQHVQVFFIISSLLQIISEFLNRFYSLLVPPVSEIPISVADTTTTFINANFKPEESVHDSFKAEEACSVSSKEQPTQTSLKQGYYIDTLEKVFGDQLSSITHKSFCLKHGVIDGSQRKPFKVAKEACYERVADVKNAIKKFEVLIQKEQKQAFQFKSDTMKLIQQKKKFRELLENLGKYESAEDEEEEEEQKRVYRRLLAGTEEW